MRKYIIMGICGVVIITALMFVFLHVFGTKNNTYSESESEKIKSFFNDNYSLFKNIKDGLWPSKYNYVTLEQNGYIVSHESNGSTSKIWDANISEKSMEYFKIAKFPNPSIECGGDDKNKTVEFLFYYDSNHMRVGIVYSETNLSGSSFYKPIQDNWYFVQQGMT